MLILRTSTLIVSLATTETASRDPATLHARTIRPHDQFRQTIPVTWRSSGHR